MTYTKKNDNYDKVYYRATTRAGEVIDLTGASVQFKMEAQSGELLVDSPATVLNATNGEMEYQLQDGDTIIAGLHRAEFTISFVEGSEKTFPEDGYIQVNITSDIETNRETEVIEKVAYTTTVIYWKSVVSTYADLPSVKENGDTYQVENDVTATNNGTWRWDGENWVKINSPQAYDTRLINAETNISDHETRVTNNETGISTLANDIDDLAGVGRTTETVMSNKDEINILSGESGVVEKLNKADYDYQMSLQDQQTQTLTHGLQIIESDQASPIKVEFYGNTLVNHMGNQGGFHSQGKWGSALVIDTSTYKFGTSSGKVDNSAGTSIKYVANNQKMYLNGKYVLLGFWVKANTGNPSVSLRLSERNSDGSLVNHNTLTKTISNQWTFYYQKFDLTAKSASYYDITLSVNSYGSADDIAYFDGGMVTPLTSTQYNKIGVSLLDADVERMFPYIDSIKGVRNPVIRASGQNLLPPFTEWELSTNATIEEPYLIKSDQASNLVEVDALASQEYAFSITMTGNRAVVYYIDEKGSAISSSTLLSSTGSKIFTTPANTKKIKLYLYNSTTGTGFTYSQPMLNLGSTALPFVEKNDSYMYFSDVTLYGNDVEKDILSYNSGASRWEKIKNWETGVVLDTYGTINTTSRTNVDIVPLKTGTASYNDSFIKDDFYVVDNNGKVYETIRTLNDDVNEVGKIYINPSELYLVISKGATTDATLLNFELTYQLADAVIEPVKVQGDLNLEGDAQVSINSGGEFFEPLTVDGTGQATLAHSASEMLSIYDETSDVAFTVVDADTIKITNYDSAKDYTANYIRVDKYNFTTNVNEVIAYYNSSLKSTIQSMSSKQSNQGEIISIHKNAIIDIYARLKNAGI